MTCACPHRCEPPCLPCIAGWHTKVCEEFVSLNTPNYRLRGVKRDPDECGRCGARERDHTREAVGW